MNLFAPCTASSQKSEMIANQFLEQCTMHCGYSADELPAEWGAIAKDFYPLYQIDYLKILEDCPPVGLETAYVWWTVEGKVIGIMPLQCLLFEAEKSFNGHTKAFYGNFWTQIKSLFKERVKRSISLPTIVAGNLLLSGSPPAVFRNQLSKMQQWELITLGISTLSKTWTPGGKRIVLQLVKDFDFSLPESYSGSYVEVNIQPAMVLNIPKTWSDFDDFLNAMSSKYRVRFRRAAKYAEGLICEPISIVMLQDNKTLADELNLLYLDVVSDAGFNLIKLHPKYFSTLAQKMEGRFNITGWYSDGKLVGFHTTLANGKSLEAHFLGFKRSFNNSHQLYLNMLYALVKEAMEGGYNSINFARTALEIKSSVGAAPVYYHSFLRHRKPMAKSIVQGALKMLNPAVKWEQRHPFKE